MPSTMHPAGALENAVVESIKPFDQTLRGLLELKGITQRELTRICERHGWGSTGTINQLSRGALAPSIVAMKEVATALGEDPMIFAEYRLAKAREEFDPSVVGLETALGNLARFRGG